MTTLPQSHIEDAHKLIADGKVSLWQIMPVSGGTIFLKGDETFTYLGNKYEGIPIQISGERMSADTSTPTPRLSIGQENMDLLPFKGMVNDGYLEGARIVRHKVLMSDLIGQVNAKQTDYFRVKRVENYTRTKINMLLSSASGASNQTYPFRQYTPPAFPWVDLS
jgi:phage-related protein